jgi:hypothetical protein
VSGQGRILASAYLSCNPPLHGHRAGKPVTVLDRLTVNGLRRVTTASVGGELAFGSLAW